MAGSVSFDVIARDRASAVFSHVGNASSELGGKLSKVGAIAGLAIGGAAIGAVAGLGVAMVQGVKDAAAYQQLADKTAAVLKSTGNAAHQSVAGIQARAAALESMSGVDETLIINGQNVLATFTGIKDGVGKGNDIFNQATTAALNMSTALGQDMQSSTVQLGKALNDPIKGITALSRVGVSFTAAQKETIKTMVKSGDTMGAQKVILKELGTEFGGAAAAAGQGFSGSMARAKDAVDDAMRSVGTLLLPVLTKMANFFSSNIAPALTNFVSGMQSGAGAGGAFSRVLQDVGTFVSQLWTRFQQLLPTIQRIASGVIPSLVAAFHAVADFVRTNVIPVVVQLAQFFVQHVIPAVVKLAQAFMGGLKTALTIIGQAISAHRAELTVLGNALRVVGAFILDHLVPVVGVILKQAFTTLGTGISAAITIISGLVNAFQTVGRWGVWLWNNALMPSVKMILEGFRNIIRGAADMVSALSNIPGFGWAKDAASKLYDLANKAGDAASALHRIQSPPPIRITADVSQVYSAIDNIKRATATGININAKMAAMPGRATGGPVVSGTTYMVGESGPEMFTPGNSGSILTASTTAALANRSVAPNHTGPAINIERYYEAGNSADQVAADFMFRLRSA